MSTTTFDMKGTLEAHLGPAERSSGDVLLRLLAVADAAFDSNRDVARSCVARAAALLQGIPEPAQGWGGRAGVPRGGLAPWQAKRIAAHIETNLGQPLRVAELAELAGLSTSHFSRAFRQSFGAAPVNYLAMRRMRRAQQLILSSSEPLAQVALACGLCDQAHFTRVFRRVVGMSPSAWRRMCAAGPADSGQRPREPGSQLRSPLLAVTRS